MRVWLRRWHRLHAPRHAGRGQAHQAAVGHVQGARKAAEVSLRCADARCGSQGFDLSGPVSALVPAARVRDPMAGAIWCGASATLSCAAWSGSLRRTAHNRLSVNGVVKQRSNLSHHIWSVSETVRRADAMQDAGGDAHAPRCRLGPTQIAHLSRLVALAPGDLLFMGTPEGVGAVGRGDVVEAAIDGCAPVAAVCCSACRVE